MVFEVYIPVPSSPLFEVYISLPSSGGLAEMMEWAADQDVIVKQAIPRHSENAFGRPITYGFTFEFDSEEDATAFKLRWL